MTTQPGPGLPDLKAALAARPARSPVAPAAKSAHETVEDTEPRQSAPVQRKPTKRTTAPENAVIWTRSIGYNMPRDLQARAKVRAKQDGITLTAWLLGALNEHHKDLAGWLVVDNQDGGLFSVPQKRLSQPSTQSTMRVTDEQYNAITRLTEQLSTNRSALFTAAAEAELAD